jgi:hypothetical protein
MAGTAGHAGRRDKSGVGAGFRSVWRHKGLAIRVASGNLSRMVEPVSLSSVRDDTLWAVIASVGRTTRVAEIFNNRLAAMADLAWREQQVRAYANFLRMGKQPWPSYTVRPIRRGDLPRSWRPLPALGFLHGKFV